MKYTPQGHGIILIDPPTVTDEVRAFAQRHADETGHVCEVFAPNGVDVLAQVRPTPAPAPVQPATLLGGVVGWLTRNIQDPDE